MTHILSNIPEEYQNFVEILKDNLDDKDNPLSTERICDKLLVKYDQMNKQSRPKMSREDEKAHSVKSQYKGACTTYRK